MLSSACSVDAESVPELNPARCIDDASSTYITSSLSSPSPGRSLQSGHPLGSAQVPLDAAVVGRKVTVAFSPSDFPLRNCDLFSMSWHNPTELGCQLLLPVAASLPSGRVAPPRLDGLAASCGVGTIVSNDLLSVRAPAPVTRCALRLSTTGGRPRGGDPIYPTACCTGPVMQRAASTSTQTEACHRISQALIPL